MPFFGEEGFSLCAVSMEAEKIRSDVTAGRAEYVGFVKGEPQFVKEAFSFGRSFHCRSG